MDHLKYNCYDISEKVQYMKLQRALGFLLSMDYSYEKGSIGYNKIVDMQNKLIEVIYFLNSQKELLSTIKIPEMNGNLYEELELNRLERIGLMVKVDQLQRECDLNNRVIEKLLTENRELKELIKKR